MTICSDVSHRGTQFLTRSNATKYALGWLGLADYAQSLTIPSNLPKPKFAIGDKVVSPWPAGSFDEDDCEGEVPEPEIGEIAGICWHPESRQWKYAINWTSGSGEAWMYPCFDDCLVDDSNLERLS